MAKDTGLEFALDLIERQRVEDIADEVRRINRAMREDVLRSDVCDAVRIVIRALEMSGGVK